MGNLLTMVRIKVVEDGVDEVLTFPTLEKALLRRRDEVLERGGDGGSKSLGHYPIV